MNLLLHCVVNSFSTFLSGVQHVDNCCVCGLNYESECSCVGGGGSAMRFFLFVQQYFSCVVLVLLKGGGSDARAPEPASSSSQ